jgi:hypothetical protein
MNHAQIAIYSLYSLAVSCDSWDGYVRYMKVLIALLFEQSTGRRQAWGSGWWVTASCSSGWFGQTAGLQGTGTCGQPGRSRTASNHNTNIELLLYAAVIAHRPWSPHNQRSIYTYSGVKISFRIILLGHFRVFTRYVMDPPPTPTPMGFWGALKYKYKVT